MLCAIKLPKSLSMNLIINEFHFQLFSVCFALNLYYFMNSEPQFASLRSFKKSVNHNKAEFSDFQIFQIFEYSKFSDIPNSDQNALNSVNLWFIWFSPKLGILKQRNQNKKLQRDSPYLWLYVYIFEWWSDCIAWLFCSEINYNSFNMNYFIDILLKLFLYR